MESVRSPRQMTSWLPAMRYNGSDGELGEVLADAVDEPWWSSHTMTLLGARIFSVVSVSALMHS